MVLVVIKTLDMNRYVCIKTYLYILPEISAHHLQLKCMGGHFFSVPSYIESTTVLSDYYYYYSYYYYYYYYYYCYYYCYSVLSLLLLLLF